jgi:hypothetical protein
VAGVTGVDHGRRLRAQIHSCKLPGNETAATSEVCKSCVRTARLFSEPDAPSARVPQRSDEHGREHRCLDFVTHGIGHRKVQGVAFKGEVEGVASDIAGRFQPSRQRELPGFAGVGTREQPVLISAASDSGTER